MKRKVVRHGPNTLTISIPANWAQKHEIQKGEEIDILEVPGGLVLSPRRPMQSKELSVKGLTTIIPDIINALYIKGCTEAKLEYAETTEREAIRKATNRVIGFEIINESNNIVHIKQVSSPHTEEFQTVLKRTFHCLSCMADECMNVASGRSKGYSECHSVREQMIRAANICRRMATNHATSDCLQWVLLLEHLEKIGEQYLNICRLTADRNKPPSEVTLAYLSRVIGFARAFESLSNHFDLQRAKSFISLCKSSEERTPKEELELNSTTVNILSQLQALTRTMIALHIKT